MKTDNQNQPAFPSVEPPTDCNITLGLTKREWFAGMALSGMLGDSERNGSATEFAKWATETADALLAELNKEIPTA